MIPNLPDLPLHEAEWLFAVLMGLVLVVPILAERVRVPAIVGLVLAGAVVGPGMLGLVEREGAVGILGSVGLLYLMFLAGLEFDLEEFAGHRRDSVLFGATTFVVPMVLGVVSSLLLGFGVLASVLIASCWASHTLLTYPLFRRHGTVGNRAVATSVGGTILTDTAALLVLAIVAALQVGELSAGFWASLAVGVAGVAVVTLWVLPRLGRWVFATYAQGQGVRFVFVLAGLFGTAALAHLAGLEPIIGAFLAGLALNRLVPNGSQLMERIEFVGSNLLVPLFLLSVGLLIDFSLLADPRTLVMAVVFTAVAIVAKWLAAWLSGRWLGYDRDEVGAMFALSAAQAAATLAAVVVGLRIGLIDADVVNAVVMVILVTCLLTSWLAGRVAPRLARPAPRRALGTTVVMPVVRAAAAGAMSRVAAAIAHADGGVVVPLTIVTAAPGDEELARLREVNGEVEQMLRGHGVEAEGQVRLDANPAIGVLHTVGEREASLVLMGWQGPDHAAMFVLGSPVNPVVAESPAPVLLARLTDQDPSRVVLLLPPDGAGPTALGAQRLAVEVARRLADLHRCDVAVVGVAEDEGLRSAVAEQLQVAVTPDRRPAPAVARELSRPGELLVVPVDPDDLRLRVLDRVHRAAPDRQLLGVVAGRPRAGEGRTFRHAEVPLAPSV